MATLQPTLTLPFVLLGCMNGQEPTTEVATGEVASHIDVASAATMESEPDCSAFPALSSECGTFRTLSGRSVCGCRVDETADVPSCSEIDPRTPTAARYRMEGDDADPRWIVGTYPDLRGIPDAQLATSYAPENWQDAFGAAIPALYDDLGPAFEGCGDDGQGYSWVIPSISPDSRMVALGHVRKHKEDEDCGHLLRPAESDTAASILRCDGGENSPGWMVHTMFPATTNPLVHWGLSRGGQPTIYLVAGAYYRITISSEPQRLVDDDAEEDDNEFSGIVLRSVQQLARPTAVGAAIGDPDVTFNERQGTWADAYAVFLTVNPAGDRPQCHALAGDWGVMVSDLRQCRADCSEDLAYCCKTALIDVGCPTRERDWGAPTNPTLSLDGRLVAFHRDLAEPSRFFHSTIYLLENPFANGLEGCEKPDDADDGYAAPIDCRGIMSDSEIWGEAGSFCPPIEDCTAGADCSTCASVGSFEATRNELGFFEWPRGDGSSRQFLYFMTENASLDMVEVELDGELSSPAQPSVSFVGGSSPYSDWGTGFHRMRHSGTL